MPNPNKTRTRHIILNAADLLGLEAKSLRESHTLSPAFSDWGDDTEAKASYEKMIRAVTDLRCVANWLRPKRAKKPLRRRRP